MTFLATYGLALLGLSAMFVFGVIIGGLLAVTDEYGEREGHRVYIYEHQLEQMEESK